MSGILGIWNLDDRPVTQSVLGRMSATLTHRGTDAHGFEIRDSIGFACRLSRIVPESAFESQPLVDASGLILVFDGRLDNRDELLAALPAAPDLCAASPDSVVALAAYRTYGEAFAEHLNGDFALGLFDPHLRQIVLARDAIGVRPLYYYAGRHFFLFASEIKALLAHPDVAARPADEVLADFMFNRLSSADDRGLTFFDGVLSLLPAHLAIVTAQRIIVRRYWDFDLSRRVRLGSFGDYADAFRNHFERAVRRRLRSAGPVAVSVSGGLDSSAIFCVAERLRRTAARRSAQLLGVSCIGADGSPSDEKPFLREIEQKYDLKIHRFELLPKGLLDCCREAVWHTESPLLDSQWNGTHFLMAATRALGARVLLTGHWGDQLLFDDGYLVDLCRRGAWWKAGRHLREYGRWIDVSDGHFERRLLNGLGRSMLPDTMIQLLRTIRGALRPTKDPQPWYTDRFRSRANKRSSFAIGRRPGSVHAASLYREATSRYHVLCMEWNNKVGAMHGLEMAFPFLDRDLIAFLIATPGEMHAASGVPKAILREALRGVLPDLIVSRASKADFTDVVNAGVAQDYGGIVRHLSKRGLAVGMGYVRKDIADHLARNASAIGGPTCTASWAVADLLGLELWLQMFVDTNHVHPAATSVAGLA